MLIGVDLGGTKIEAAALDETGAVRARERVSTPRAYEPVLRAIGELVVGLEARFGRSAGVGVGVPGSISPASGLIRNANADWLNGRALDRDLKEAIGRPVRVENDANCLAVSEAVDGAGTGAHVVFAVIIGTGCGAGVAIDGRALSGRNGIAGEFGHNALPRPLREGEAPGPLCWCGRRGCVETFLSGPGFAARHAEAGGAETAAPDIVAAARAGDGAARASLDLYRDRLARALASVANILDPDVIVLGGGMSNVAEIYDGLDALVGTHAFSDRFDTPVRPARHGDSSGVRGAAWLWRAQTKNRPAGFSRAD